jgi:hypothetical protein
MGLKSKDLSKVRDDVPVASVMKEDTIRVNINVPGSMQERWKMAAVKARRPLTALVIDAMEQYLAQQKH